MPRSTGALSGRSSLYGVAPLSREHGHETLTVRVGPEGSVLPESSLARTLIVVDGLPCAVQAYVQLVVPLARCQVVPLSVETSTPATTPPPASAAVPEIVVVAPSGT